MEVFAENATVAAQVAFSLAPKVLDAVDVVTFTERTRITR